MKFLLIYVPNLRFSFEEDWCTSTIGENFRLSSGLTPSTKEKAYFNNGIIPWINSGELKNKYISSTENKLTLDAVKKHNLTIYPMDTMVIAIYGLEAAGVRGKASITKMDSTISQSCMAFNSLGNVLTQFMYYVYKKEAQILGTRYAQGTKQQNLSSDLLSSYKLLYPSKEEQLKIVNFLSLIDEKIETQIKIIDTLLSEINSIRSLIFNKSSLKWIPLKDIVAEQDIKLKRGKVIPKHKKNLKYIYPVYSSSITNSGLMGYSDSYMFNQELITWSIDGGGNFFYRKKHKFNITNVSGYMILNENLFNYQFIVQSLIWQHEKLKFDYQTKAHPSVVESLYKIPIMDLEEQHKYACLFSNLNEKYELELHTLDLLNMQKKYLLKNMFV